MWKGSTWRLRSGQCRQRGLGSKRCFDVGYKIPFWIAIKLCAQRIHNKEILILPDILLLSIKELLCNQSVNVYIEHIIVVPVWL